MKALGYKKFLQTLPQLVLPQLPPALSHLQAHQPFSWLLQIHGTDKRLHYEVQHINRQRDLELGLHFESKNKALNQQLLTGFLRNLVAIRAELGDSIEAEEWDRGWTKVYEIYPNGELTLDYQQAVAARIVTIISTLHPIMQDILAGGRTR